MSPHHGPNAIERHADVAVIGGSAAGLAAALQLGRQRRAVIVVDAGEPRNAPAAHMHGFLGRDGTPPTELTAAGRDDVRRYGGEILDGRATAVRRRDDGRFRIELVGGHAVVARRVVVATGLVDELPAIDGLAEQWGRGVIHCPFCHGYEVRDRRLVQIVTHPAGLHPTPLFRQLTDRLTVVLHAEVDIDAGQLAPLQAAGVDVVAGAVTAIRTGPDGEVTGVVLRDGDTIDADAVVVGPRFRARAELLAPLGLAPFPHPIGLGDHLAVDATGLTAIPGIYAAGNVTDPSQQALHAAAHGSRVGAMVSFSLADEEVRDAPRPSANEADWDHRYADRAMWSGNPNGTLVAEAANLAPGRALDVGAGEGADAIWLAERGWTVTANDISRRGLARGVAEAERRGLPITPLVCDANALDAFEPGGFDLVSAQYASIPRTADDRAIGNLLDAVAPGGTLLVVGHDLAPMRTPIDTTVTSRAFDPDAYVRVEDVAAVLADSPDWVVETHETRLRPPGAASASHHVDDVVLRARRASATLARPCAAS